MRVSFRGNTELNVLYFNDVHAKSKNLASFKTGVDVFDRQNENKSTMKIAGGDLNMDKSIKPNSLVFKVMDMIGLDASSVGNHDMEGGDYWVKAFNQIKPRFKFLSANMNYTRPNSADGMIAKSMIINRDGENYGLIGVSPLDAPSLVFSAPFNDFMQVQPFDKTIASVKNEVNKLEDKGIDKIFLLAHTGKASKEGVEYYENLAKIGGIDIIFGGHDHKEFDLWYKSDRNEPVKVVSVGKADDKDIVGEDLDSFGILKAIFDDDGVLIPKECSNKVELTSSYEKDSEIVALEETYLNSSKVLSRTNRDLVCHNRMTKEHPVADLAADAMLYVVNKDSSSPKAQISLINSGTLRGDFKMGNITIGMVREALPFTQNTLIKTPLTKKQIFEALSWGAKSTSFAKIAPGLIQVGGLKYSYDKNFNIKNAYIVKEDGSLGECLDEAPDDKKYMVAYDTFLQTGALGMECLKKSVDDSSVEYFPESRQDALSEYLEAKFSDKPVDFVQGRIFQEK